MESTREDNRHRLSFAIIAVCWQIVLFFGFASIDLLFVVLMIILFAFLTDYGSGAKLNTGSDTNMDHYYPLFQDVNVMIFVGFGFLMTFLSKYGFSAVGYNFLISAFTVQWSILTIGVMHGAFHQNSAGEADPFHKSCPALGTAASAAAKDFNGTEHARFCIQLNIENLITGDFAAGAVMITFGAVLGKTNPMQMLVVAILEIVFYTLNESIGAGLFSAVDMGGSIFVHTFGAYFGLALSLAISSAKDSTGKVADRPKNGSSKTSDLFAMIGTLFLWFVLFAGSPLKHIVSCSQQPQMFWPSFNGALATDEQQHRVVINTVLALCACCVAAFAMDAFVRPGHKFDMVSIQNATLAGGVAVGSSSDLVIQPYGALIVGCVAGIVSVVGYVYLDPCFKKIGLDDTCGVHNLHGMPGIVGALGGAISAASAGSNAYGESIGTVFPARAGLDGRTAGEQGGYQIAALVVTLLISLVGGLLTGFIVKLSCFQYHGPVFEGEEDNAQQVAFLKFGAALDERVWYDDKYYWEVPSDSEVNPQTIIPVNGSKEDPSEAKEDPSEAKEDPSEAKEESGEAGPPALQ